MIDDSSSLRGQLLRWLLMPMLLLLVLGSIVTYILALDYARTAYDRALFDTTLTLAGQIHPAQGGLVRVELPPIARKMLTQDQYDKVYFRVDDLTARQMLIGTSALPDGASQLMDETEPNFYDAVVDGAPVRIAATTMQSGGHRIVVQTAETLQKRELLTRQILTGITVPQVVLIVLVCGLLWFGVRRGLQPLQTLQDAVMQRTPTDLRPLDESGAPQEVRGLIHSLNSLLGRTALLLEAQQRFISNAAHQLRTPLSGLKAQIDFALRLTDPVELQHSLQQIQIGAERSVRMVRQLLSLARAEPAAAIQGDVQVDLGKLAGSVTAQWVPVARKHRQDLGFECGQDEVHVSGDPVLLAEMLGNLIDNALRYTPAGGAVTVSVTALGRGVELVVDDNGPGIPIKERERVTERFYRLPDSPGDGCGLGLSIVREIAHRHGASLSIGAGNEGMGTRIVVHFPGGDTA